MARSSHYPDAFDSDINILLLSVTGWGKSTFLNAFINHLTYDTLDIALKYDLKVLKPTFFRIYDDDTDEDHQVVIGIPDENESLLRNRHSSTETCRSYVFRLSNRRIRFIDTPGIGCAQGFAQDLRNIESLLCYIEHYRHLSGIFIFLKSSENRLTGDMKYYLEQLFALLSTRMKDNVAYVFTNARFSFYNPGEMGSILMLLFAQWQKAKYVMMPFRKDNSFMFDNESFWFFAINKNGMNSLSHGKEIYSQSWDLTTKELRRLIQFVLTCTRQPTDGCHAVYEARYLAYKIARPIAEFVRLIQENISLTKQYKDNLLTKPLEQVPYHMPQRIGKFVPLDEPLMVCCNSTCMTVETENGETTIKYLKCHPVKDSSKFELPESINLLGICYYLREKNIGQYVTLLMLLIRIDQ